MKEEERFTDSEAKLRIIIDSSPDAITVIDLNGKIIDCNQATVDMHGFSNMEELIGKDGYKLISPKETENAKKNLKDLLESGIRKDHEYTLLRKDGSEFPGEVSSGLITDSQGKPTSLVIISKDISKRKKAEEELKKSEEWFRALIENSASVYTVVDAQGKAIYQSPYVFLHCLAQRHYHLLLRFSAADDRHRVARRPRNLVSRSA